MSPIKSWLKSGDTKSWAQLYPSRRDVLGSGSMFIHSTAVEGPCGDSKLPNWDCWHCEGWSCDPTKHMGLRANNAFSTSHGCRCSSVSVKCLTSELRQEWDAYGWSMKLVSLWCGPHWNVVPSLDHRWVGQMWQVLIPQMSFPIKSTAFSLKSKSRIILTIKL